MIFLKIVQVQIQIPQKFLKILKFQKFLQKVLQKILKKNLNL